MKGIALVGSTGRIGMRIAREERASGHHVLAGMRINNMGPELNQLGPAGNYIPLSDFQTWICSFTMVLGRLEVMTLLVLFTPQFWRR